MTYYTSVLFLPTNVCSDRRPAADYGATREVWLPSEAPPNPNI
jgi:hypothetical protein